LEGQLEGKIGTREFFAIIIITLSMKATDNTTNLLYTIGKNAAWLVILVSTVTTCIPLIIIFKLVNAHKKGLIDIMHESFGKFLTWIIGIMMFIFTFASVGVNSRGYVDTMKSLYFPRTPQFVLYIVLMGSCYIIARFGIEDIGNIDWVILPYIDLIFINDNIFAWKYIRFEYIFPILGSGVKKIVVGGIMQSAYLNEVLTYSIIFQNVKSYKGYKDASLFGLWVSIIIMIWFFIMYVAVFDYPTVSILNFMFHTFTRFIHIGRFFQNLDAIYLTFWVLGSIVRFAAYLYTAIACLTFTFKIKDGKILLLPISILSMIAGMLPENLFVETTWRKTLIYGSTVTFFFTPIILFVIAKFKGVKV
jgi:spore germination protein (amino acid permease)